MEGVQTVEYDLHRTPAPSTHHYVRPLEAGVLYGQAVARTLLSLKEKGFVPDIVIAHPGWGEALYVKDVFSNTKLISFFEFFYHAEGADCNFDPQFPIVFDDRARIRTKNALNLLNLETCDFGVSPTNWQKSVHPSSYHQKIKVIHEGIDTELLQPDDHAILTLPNGETLSREQNVITYVARNLEPYRGFPTFMKAVERLCQSDIDCRILIIGGDEVSYGRLPADAKSWREKFTNELSIDPNRVHFLGKVPYNGYRKVLQISSAHVYLTYPFVLSWSMLEAMATGCVVIGSSTAPVQEVVNNGENGFLVDFFDEKEIVNKIEFVLSNKNSLNELRQKARETIVEQYSLREGLNHYLSLIEEAYRLPL